MGCSLLTLLQVRDSPPNFMWVMNWPREPGWCWLQHSELVLSLTRCAEHFINTHPPGPHKGPWRKYCDHHCGAEEEAVRRQAKSLLGVTVAELGL